MLQLSSLPNETTDEELLRKIDRLQQIDDVLHIAAREKFHCELIKRTFETALRTGGAAVAEVQLALLSVYPDSFARIFSHGSLEYIPDSSTSAKWSSLEVVANTALVGPNWLWKP
jgi:hypothetical protein